MTEQPKPVCVTESLSAMLDNEASPLEQARVLRDCSADAKIADTWSRYQIARAAMRGDAPSHLAPLDFASNLSAALAEEPTPKAQRQPMSRWWVGLGRVAVAASVTGAVVIGAQLYQQQKLPSEAQVASNSSAEKTVNPPDFSLPAGFRAPALPARQVSAETYYTPRQPRRQVVFEPRQQRDVKVSNEQIRAYLNQLVEHHADQAVVNSSQGMMPYARVPLVEGDR